MDWNVTCTIATTVSSIALVGLTIWVVFETRALRKVRRKRFWHFD